MNNPKITDKMRIETAEAIVALNNEAGYIRDGFYDYGTDDENEEMAAMTEADAVDVANVLLMAENGYFEAAHDMMMGMDTEAREHVPDDLYYLIVAENE